MAAQQAQICGHFVTRFQQHNVTRYQAVAFQCAALAVSNYRGLQCQHVANGVHGFFRLALLNHTNNGINNDHAKNDKRVYPVLQQCRQDTGYNKNNNQQISELFDKPGERAGLRGLGQFIGSVLLQTC